MIMSAYTSITRHGRTPGPCRSGEPAARPARSGMSSAGRGSGRTATCAAGRRRLAGLSRRPPETVRPAAAAGGCGGGGPRVAGGGGSPAARLLGPAVYSGLFAELTSSELKRESIPWLGYLVRRSRRPTSSGARGGRSGARKARPHGPPARPDFLTSRMCCISVASGLRLNLVRAPGRVRSHRRARGACRRNFRVGPSGRLRRLALAENWRVLTIQG